jgi:predicted Zn-dependent protease
MIIENPEIPEGINVSPTHSLKEFFQLVVAVAIVILLIVTALSLVVEKLAVYIPFSLEQDIAGNYVDMNSGNEKTRLYLQSMADDLARYMALEDEMHVTVHYVDDATMNAFATIGGHVFVHRGLMDILPNENALAMVVAHEIGHIKHRHPIIAMGRGVVIGLLLASLSGIDANRIVGDIATTAGSVALLKFSREQERKADRDGLTGVVGVYGHASGADDLFEAFMEKRGASHLRPEFLSTHPFDRVRVQEIRDLAIQNNWELDLPTKPLPDFSGVE